MADFNSLRVDRAIETGQIDGRFVTSSYCFLCAGPPRLQDVGGASLFGQSLSTGTANRFVRPIGGIQAANLAGNKAFQRLFEIGSHRSFWVPSHAVQQLMLNRVYFHGPSLLRLLYSYFSDYQQPEIIFPLFNYASTPRNPHNVIIPPGYENLYLNLASDLFDQSFGMMLYVQDNSGQAMGAFYLENAVVPSQNWATDAMGSAIQESAVVQFEWMVPVQVDQIALIAA